jgi:hypothetical protein
MVAFSSWFLDFLSRAGFGWVCEFVMVSRHLFSVYSYTCHCSHCGFEVDDVEVS